MARLILSVLSAALVLAPVPTSAADLLTVRLSQRMMSAPGALQITMIVERQDANRAIVVEAESEAFYRSSLISLNGSSSALAHSVRYTQLPEGSYLIRVSLYNAESVKLAVSEQLVEVVGSETDGKARSRMLRD